MQSTEKVNKKKKIVNYERAPGICDSLIFVFDHKRLKTKSIVCGVSRQKSWAT